MDNSINHYSSFTEFVDHAAQRLEQTDCWVSASVRSHPVGNTTSLDEALTLARQGWPEGTDKLQDVDVDTDDMVYQQLAPSWAYDVAGMIPDVAMYCAGVDEHMATPLQPETTATSIAPTINLVVQGAAAASVTESEITALGCAVLSHVRALQASGRSVTVTWLQASESNAYWVGTVPLLRADHPTDIDILAFAMLHPGMLRRLWFAVAELEPSNERRLGEAFGTPAKPEDHAIVRRELSENSLLMPHPNDVNNRSASELSEEVSRIIQG